MLVSRMNRVDEKTAAGFFPPTIWSTIYKAKGERQEDPQAALDRVLRRYRKPILLHIQASLTGDNRTPERAEDLTQEFLQQCLERKFLKDVQQEKGRFRAYIKACITNFLRDVHDRESAQKRNCGHIPCSLDETDTEGHRLVEPAAPSDAPESILDRQWALMVLEQALEALRMDCVKSRKSELFEALKGHLDQGANPETAAEVGAKLNMSEAAVHTAMNRLRKRLGQYIILEVRETMQAEGLKDEEWREELKYLVELLGR
jgi:RNA polymerase sigma factor (sigma-70 family)